MLADIVKGLYFPTLTASKNNILIKNCVGQKITRFTQLATVAGEQPVLVDYFFKYLLEQIMIDEILCIEPHNLPVIFDSFYIRTRHRYWLPTGPRERLQLTGWPDLLRVPPVTRKAFRAMQ